MTPPYVPNEYDIFVGIDVDKKSFSFTVMDHATMKRQHRIPANPEYLYRYIQERYTGKQVLCVYEAGPTGYHLYDYLKERQQPCLVVSPSSIAKAANQKVKNNRIDSEKLAEELRSGKATSIRIPEGPYRELRHLIATRENYAASHKIAKQRIKGLLLYTHLHTMLKDDEQKWSNRYIKELKDLACSSAERHRLDMLLMDLEYARKQTLVVLKQIRMFCKEHPAVNRYRRYLQSIPGIGFITALTMLARIGDPAHLKNVRELASFLGLVPRENSTGDRVNRGTITHMGNRSARSLLVEAAWVAIRGDVELRQFFYRIKKKHHPTIAARKAIVAVARKLSARIYCVLKEQKIYEIR